ncbi:hypothetical protein AB0M58_38860 [Streptomyces bobili]|uniref:hypothetical protein n=1 Tax=Streptomyces bobili TaxID=67280 RepID=UPI0034168FFE
MGTDPGSAVVVITGVMGAEKSTVFELLAGQLPRAAHVRGVVSRRMVVSGRETLLPEETTETRAQPDLRYRLAAVVQDIILGNDLTRYVARVHTRPLSVIVLALYTAVVPPERLGARSRVRRLDRRGTRPRPAGGDSPHRALARHLGAHAGTDAMLDNLPAAPLESG